MVNRKLLYKKGNSSYIIEEDLVGWYLLHYVKERAEQDFLLDSLEEALSEAEDEFGISRDSWNETSE